MAARLDFSAKLKCQTTAVMLSLGIN